MDGTYGNRRPNAKMTLSLVETAAWRPHTRWTAMTKRPTSVAMSRPAIVFHWANKEPHFSSPASPNWIHGSLKSQRSALSSTETKPRVSVMPRATQENFL